MPRKSKKKQYFTKETEEYIVEYNNSTDIEHRNKIFSEHIYYPFYKLAENIIHTFKFYYTDVEQIEDLKHEVVSMLLEEKISKFDPANGAKAYSYFGTIVKRWLINYNNKYFRKLKQETSFENYEEIYETDYELENKNGYTLSSLIDEWVEETYTELEEIFLKPQDKQIADAILTVFKARRNLDIFKKKALYIYIREITNCETTQLTRVATVLKGIFKRKYNKIYEKGLLLNL